MIICSFSVYRLIISPESWAAERGAADCPPSRQRRADCSANRLARHRELIAHCTEATRFDPCAPWLYIERDDASVKLDRCEERSPATSRPAAAAVTRTPSPSAARRQSRTTTVPSASTATLQRLDGPGRAGDLIRRRRDRDRRARGPAVRGRRERGLEHAPVPRRPLLRQGPAAGRHRRWRRIHRPGPEAARRAATSPIPTRSRRRGPGRGSGTTARSAMRLRDRTAKSPKRRAMPGRAERTGTDLGERIILGGKSRLRHARRGWHGRKALAPAAGKGCQPPRGPPWRPPA